MKPRNLWVPEGYTEDSIEDRCGKYIEWVEYSAYESLERKLAIAVKTLTAISDHWVDYELGEMTHEGRAAKEALEKIKGEK